MAQKRKRRKNRKWILKLIIVLLLVAAVFVCYFVWDSYFKDKDGDIETTHKEQETEKVEKVEETEVAGEEGGKGNVAEKEKVVQYEGEDPNDLEELTGVVTYAGVVDGNLMIRVNIDQFLSGGSCTLSLIKEGSNVYSETTEIVSMVSTSTCDGFDVVQGLSSGNYNIVIILNSEGKTGRISGEVSI